MQRIDKENYYLDIAQTVLERSTCLRRWYGAIIVRNDEIVATGYNGAPRGRANCNELGVCIRNGFRSPGASDMSSAAASTPRPTPSFPPLATSVSAQRCIWWAGTR